ncbi:hypothetical protein LIER_13731 [Lithospermum erythrorhizon]|uniref:Uncharacterized protein n=1 Tax=Lithospermum erythrorhizon TaxID=34254 RepID=A0AAV3PWL7_LITER
MTDRYFSKKSDPPLYNDVKEERWFKGRYKEKPAIRKLAHIAGLFRNGTPVSIWYDKKEVRMVSVDANWNGEEGLWNNRNRRRYHPLCEESDNESENMIS